MPRYRGSGSRCGLPEVVAVRGTEPFDFGGVEQACTCWSRQVDLCGQQPVSDVPVDARDRLAEHVRYLRCGE